MAGLPETRRRQSDEPGLEIPGAAQCLVAPVEPWHGRSNGLTPGRLPPYRCRMHRRTASAAVLTACLVSALLTAVPRSAPASSPQWNAAAAAAYLDGRMGWWLTWPNAQRDHDTACVSCHTALPYALARPALRGALADRALPAAERRMLEHVVKRVTMWKDVEPFYPDQLRGLPKTSESRATEAILNALILSTRDAQTGSLSDDARQAFANLWPLQFKAGDLAGAWTWLNFHNEPWEANASPYFGNALAALAIGTAPGGYAASPDLQDRLALLQRYLQAGVEKESLYNRLTVLWASGKWPTLLTAVQRQAIVQAALEKQQDDGGWTLASLSDWKRADGTPLDSASDGLATGLATLALQQAGVPRAAARLGRGLAWLSAHQDAATGMWPASSLNKRRDPASDVGKFMTDAATAYAVLSLTNER